MVVRVFMKHVDPEVLASLASKEDVGNILTWGITYCARRVNVNVSFMNSISSRQTIMMERP